MLKVGDQITNGRFQRKVLDIGIESNHICHNHHISVEMKVYTLTDTNLSTFAIAEWCEANISYNGYKPVKRRWLPFMRSN